MRKVQRSRRRKEPPLVGSVLCDKERVMIQLRASAAAKGARFTADGEDPEKPSQGTEGFSCHRQAAPTAQPQGESMTSRWIHCLRRPQLP